jgi:TonB family protein
VSPAIRIRLALALGLSAAWSCASGSGRQARECTSDLPRYARSLDEVSDSAALQQGIERVWSDAAGLTLATLIYDSLGAYGRATLLTESYDRAGREALIAAIAEAARPEADPDERFYVVLGDERGPGVRRVERFHGCAPLLLHREVIVRRLEEEARSLRVRDRLRVQLWVRVGGDGEVTEVRIAESSRDRDADLAALRVAHTLTFRPAMIEGFVIPGVWADIPITFGARGR